MVNKIKQSVMYVTSLAENRVGSTGRTNSGHKYGTKVVTGPKYTPLGDSTNSFRSGHRGSFTPNMTK
jgi:hypothetical protein